MIIRSGLILLSSLILMPAMAWAPMPALGYAGAIYAHFLING